MSRPLFEADPDVALAIDNETRRQHEGLELIASENFVSEAVLEAMGSVFTNKYAEGYPGKAAASSPTWSRTWPATVPSSSLAPNMRTSSLMLDRRRTWRPMRRLFSLGTPFLA
jgi:hypothetical protein